MEDVHLVDTPEELLARLRHDSNELVMTLQEFIDFEEYVRCICIGREHVLPIQYDPKRRCYIVHDGPLAAQGAQQKVLEDALKLNHALGYDMNSVEFAIKDGVPYAIDFTNPAPDMHLDSILPALSHRRRLDGRLLHQVCTRGARACRRLRVSPVSHEGADRSSHPRVMMGSCFQTTSATRSCERHGRSVRFRF